MTVTFVLNIPGVKSTKFSRARVRTNPATEVSTVPSCISCIMPINVPLDSLEIMGKNPLKGVGNLVRSDLCLDFLKRTKLLSLLKIQIDYSNSLLCKSNVVYLFCVFDR